MTIGRRGLKVKVKVKVVDQATAVGPISIEGSFLVRNIFTDCNSNCKWLE